MPYPPQGAQGGVSTADFEDHKTRHQNAGLDEISVLGLSGLLADDQHVLDAEVDPRLGVLGATCWIIANDARAKLKTYATILQAAGYPVWVCDGANDEVQIQAANDSFATFAGTVILSEGNFNIEDDLIIDGCTLGGQGPGGPTNTYATRLNLSDTKTIIIRRYLVCAGRLKDVLIYCPSGFTGDALEIAAGVGDVKGLLENVRVVCFSFDDTGTPTGRGLWLHAEAATGNRYVTKNSFFGVSVEGFEYGVVLTAEDSDTNDGHVNANKFFDLSISHCKNPLILDDAGTYPGAVEGNIFLPVTIESYNGAVNGVHLATSVNRNQILLSEWTPPAWYSGSLMLCDVGTAFNLIEGHFDVTGITDNGVTNRVERLTNREPGARVYNNANIAIDNTTTTALTFNSERYDTDGIHDTGSNTSRLTCKTPGKYIIGATAAFASDAVGRRQMGIYINGTSIALQGWDTNQGAETLMSLNAVYDLAVGEYVEVKVYQSSGGALNISVLGNFSPEFWMQRIGH